MFDVLWLIIGSFLVGFFGIKWVERKSKNDLKKDIVLQQARDELHSRKKAEENRNDLRKDVAARGNDANVDFLQSKNRIREKK